MAKRRKSGGGGGGGGGAKTTSKKASMEVSPSDNTVKTDTDLTTSSNGEESRASNKRVKMDSHSETETRNDPTVSSSKNSINSLNGEEESRVVTDIKFVGEPIPNEEACQRWPTRYEQKIPKKGSSRSSSNEEGKLLAKCHYLQAEVDGVIYNLNDCAYIQGEPGKADYIGRILEFFETIDNENYFTAQWFYKAGDTVIKKHEDLIDKRRVFVSDLKDDNPLDCIISKLRIERVSPNVDLVLKNAAIPTCDFYYDMCYSLPYTTFSNISEENTRAINDSPSPVSNMTDCDGSTSESKLDSKESCLATWSPKSAMALLDLYSGCGGMSTGLCLGAALSGVNLITRWALDLNQYACQSLKLNHPETEVRNESADDFLSLLKEWEKLCKKFSLVGTKIKKSLKNDYQPSDVEVKEDVPKVPDGEFEVGKLVNICYGDPNGTEESGLYFKVRWKGYGSNEDTWEPDSGLSKCQEKIQDFITSAYHSELLPLPGDVDVICGGPPCQGISGYNRFRNRDAPLEDSKNRQVVVFMDIVEHLKPRYVLMENVVDIVRLSGGCLGRYALSRIVSMNYQARLGMMSAGCYGLPQFRMRVFLWGAHPTEKLPRYPLPTHEVIVRGGGLSDEFKESLVAYEENQPRELETALVLEDAISDLPPVTNYETNDEMHYGGVAKTEFQKFIRLSKNQLMGFTNPVPRATSKAMLFDHLPLELNADDYERVCRVPKMKGANFRNLPGVVLRGKKVEWDESIERVYLSSGKPLIPDYAMSFKDGKSSKPFGRLWWSDTVSTVVTRAEPHNQVITHPEQDRVLSVRENARLQGFPDYYKLCGPVKERYIQVGNAVAVPVARALGYALGLASQGLCSDDQPLFKLPPNFSFSASRTTTGDGDATKSSNSE